MKKLNKEQLQIIRYNKGSLNIVAGAGTGKTTVLIERVKYLISKLKILPKNILILSFNKNTVNDIYKRFSTDIKIMTFHGLSTSILKKNIDLLNDKYNCNFKIMDELETEYAIKNVLKADIKLYQYVSSFANIKYTISKIKKNLINQDILKNNKLFSYFYHKYITYLKDNNLMDFDDLNKYAYQLLLDNQNILSDLQNKYEYILIDEIQDIDFYQYQLIKLLSRNAILFIVGDLNQNIYGFRGAKNIYIELLEKDFNMLTFYLKTNYRSCNEIIKISNSLIDEKYRLVSFLNNNGKVIYRHFSNSYLENLFIIETIKNLISNGKYKYSDIVILYRKNYLATNLKDAFFVHNIPYFMKENKKDIFIDTKNVFKFESNLKHIEVKNFIRNSLEKRIDKAINKPNNNKVLLSTIHQIKGQEFKIVFLIGFEQETFMDDFMHNIDVKEERRLAYVAITRAKEHLYMTSVKERFVYGMKRDLKPISFLQEMRIKE